MTMPISWGSLASFPLSCGYKVDRGLLEALASFLGSRPTCCFSIGEVDLIPTMEESCVLRSSRPEADLAESQHFSESCLTKYFSRSDLSSARLARDFIAGQERGGRSSAINAFKIAFAGIFLFPTSAGRIDLGVIPLVFSEGRSIIPAILCETVRSLSYCRRQGEGVPDVLHTAPSALVLQSPAAFLPPPDSLSLLRDIRQSWMPWTHCALFDGVPLPGVWGCTGYYPSLALRQFGGVQYPPRPRIEDIWGGRLSEMVLIEDGLPYGQVHPYSLVSRSPSGFQLSTGQSARTVTVLERELEEARAELLSLRLARASEREAVCGSCGVSCGAPLHHNSVAVANLRPRLGGSERGMSPLSER
uniref:Aminotransferase-like plant mobile domain-containing protein n=1 Tax=Fagus sylvatica TaxID=28930 RepID=A0A2N9EQC8_FAGSY